MVAEAVPDRYPPGPRPAGLRQRPGVATARKPPVSGPGTEPNLPRFRRLFMLCSSRGHGLRLFHMVEEKEATRAGALRCGRRCDRKNRSRSASVIEWIFLNAEL